MRIINPPVRVINNKLSNVYSDQVKTIKVKTTSGIWGTQTIHVSHSDFPPTITIQDPETYGTTKIINKGPNTYDITFTPTKKFSDKSYGLFFLVNTFNKISSTNEIPTIYDATRTLIHVVNAMNYTYPNNKATDVSI